MIGHLHRKFESYFFLTAKESIPFVCVICAIPLSYQIIDVVMFLFMELFQQISEKGVQELEYQHYPVPSELI